MSSTDEHRANIKRGNMTTEGRVATRHTATCTCGWSDDMGYLTETRALDAWTDHVVAATR